MLKNYALKSKQLSYCLINNPSKHNDSKYADNLTLHCISICYYSKIKHDRCERKRI